MNVMPQTFSWAPLDKPTVLTGMERSVGLLIWPIVAILVFLPVFIQERLEPEARVVDFVYFYAASTIIHESSAENIYNPEIQRAACQRILANRDGSSTYGPSPYPPFVALLFAPAASVPFRTAFRIHQVISFALFASGLMLLLRRFFPDQPIWSSLFVPFAFGYLPWVSNTLLNGQLSALGFFAMAVALSERQIGHRFRSGLALSVCLYKPTLLILLIPLLVHRRQFRVLVGFVTGGCALVGAATIAFGWHIWSAYARLILSLSDLEKLRQLPQFVDLPAFFTLLCGNRLAVVLVAVSTVCVLLFLGAASRRARSETPLLWACAITWTLIVGPYVPIYDTILIVPSLIASAGSLQLGRERILPAILLLIFVCSWVSGALATLVHLQLLTLAIALLGLLQLAACLNLRMAVGESAAL